MRVTFVLCCLIFPLLLPAQNVAPGRRLFENRCSVCHGADANGGEMGPAITRRLPSRDDQQLAEFIRHGMPSSGMPPSQFNDADMALLIRFLRSIEIRRPNLPLERVTVETTGGGKLEGDVLNRGFDDLQLRTADHHIHLLRRSGDRYREVTSRVGWPGYNGEPGGNRYITLSQITPANVKQLVPRWIFPMPNAGHLELTPVVVDGVMYISDANDCFALDAGTGREIWHYRRPPTPGFPQQSGRNRGAAVAGNRVFLETGDARVIALDRSTGELLWDTPMADWHLNYFATSAPLLADGLVIAGLAGGEHGARGFLAAYDQATGKEVWRFWTVPKPGEPGSETWKGAGIEHGGAPTWFTGTYDAELDTVYWPSGNPSAEYNGDDREGDNLYSDCILALDAKTGKLKWYYQTTPHDLWDWDAAETPVVLDANWQGQARKLLLQANRNGFFYVLDRASGKLLLAKPFIRNLTWAKGIGTDGRPIRNPNQEPSEAGTRVCPSQDGATNWYSPSYNPGTGLFYAQTFEKCSIYLKRPTGEWREGRQYLGGAQRLTPEPHERILRAIDIQTGTVKWELPQPGPANSWGGTLTTSTGLVIFGAEDGSLMAADAATGRPLWSFPTNQSWKASPMAYEFDGREYIGAAAGGNIIAFALPQ